MNAPPRPEPGLCATCVNAKRVFSDRGSGFVQCLVHRTDPRFPKYPRLPVLACPAYRSRSAESPASAGPRSPTS